MKYRKDKYGKDLSQLGYGCMRFTKKGNSIDYAKAEKGIPVVIMEPLRGGKLVNLPKKAKEVLNAKSSYTAAELGLRWRWNWQASGCIIADGATKRKWIDHYLRRSKKNT